MNKNCNNTDLCLHYIKYANTTCISIYMLFYIELKRLYKM